MTMKSALLPLLVVASLSASAFAASPGNRNQDDAFWANVQLTEGSTPAQAAPFPRTLQAQTAAPTERGLPASASARNQDDAFWANVQLTEGITPAQAAPLPRPAAGQAARAGDDGFALESRKIEG